MTNQKNVKVSEANHKRLSRIGGVLDTMDDVIGLLLDFWDSKHMNETKKVQRM